MNETKKTIFTLHCIEEKGKDSKWSIIGHGPICYLTCSQGIAEFILDIINICYKWSDCM